MILFLLLLLRPLNFISLSTEDDVGQIMASGIVANLCPFMAFSITCFFRILQKKNQREQRFGQYQ